MSGPVVKSHIWPEMGIKSYARRKTSCLLLSRDYRQRLRANSSFTSLPQDSSRTSPRPARLRSDETDYQARGNRRDDPITKIKNKNEDNSRATGDRLRDFPEWLEEFTDNLEETEVPALANTSHDAGSECSMKVAPRKHSIYTHFLADRNSEVCKRTKMTRAPCRRRNGEEAVPRAEKFGELTTADHKVFNEGIPLTANLETVIDTLWESCVSPRCNTPHSAGAQWI